MSDNTTTTTTDDVIVHAATGEIIGTIRVGYRVMKETHETMRNLAMGGWL